jgi:hypothetical protein
VTLDFVELDVANKRVLDARVSDDVYTDARVPFDDLTREDRLWLASLIERAARAWLGRDPEGVVRFAAGALVNGGPPVDATESARLLKTFVEAVAGTLLIDASSRGITKRKGDSPS